MSRLGLELAYAHGVLEYLYQVELTRLERSEQELTELVGEHLAYKAGVATLLRLEQEHRRVGKRFAGCVLYVPVYYAAAVLAETDGGLYLFGLPRLKVKFCKAHG